MIVTVDNPNDPAGARFQTAGRHVVHFGDGGLAAQAAPGAPALVAGRCVPNAVFLTITSRLRGEW